jgi:hypothetical protein
LLVASLTSFTALTRPWWHLTRGEWGLAEEAALRLDRSWLRLFASARSTAAYTRALALHLEGRLEESLAAAEPLRQAKALRSVHLVLEGANLVLLDREPERAAAALAEACKIQAMPEDLLFLAHARLALGERVEADRLFEAAGDRRPSRAGWPPINEPVFHFLRALYLMKTGRDAEAAKDLALAAGGPVTTVYVERARALSEPPADAESDPRSSLAPQVVEDKS